MKTEPKKGLHQLLIALLHLACLLGIKEEKQNQVCLKDNRNLKVDLNNAKLCEV